MTLILIAACSPPADQARITDPPTPVPSTAASSPSPEPTRPPRRITIVGSGDILIHPSLWARAQADGGGAGPSFQQELAGSKRRVASADYAICHVEQGFNDPAGPTTEYPNYYTHPVLAEGIAAAGFDTCSTASNWTWLKGLDGVGRTNRALRKSGLTVAGSRAAEKQADNTLDQVGEVSVGHLSYTDPADSPVIGGADWAVNVADPDRIIEDAERLRADGADLVVVSLAMGDMGSTQPNDRQNKLVRKLARSGQVDLVIGHGSHTIQAAEKIDGMWAIWHGNLLSSFFPDQVRMHEGLISRVTFVEQPDGGFRATKARGDIVLSLPQAGRLIDVGAAGCGSARAQQAYDATRQTLAAAIVDGFELTAPCG